MIHVCEKCGKCFFEDYEMSPEEVAKSEVRRAQRQRRIRRLRRGEEDSENDDASGG